MKSEATLLQWEEREEQRPDPDKERGPAQNSGSIWKIPASMELALPVMLT